MSVGSSSGLFCLNASPGTAGGNRTYPLYRSSGPIRPVTKADFGHAAPGLSDIAPRPDDSRPAGAGSGRPGPARRRLGQRGADPPATPPKAGLPRLAVGAAFAEGAVPFGAGAEQGTFHGVAATAPGRALGAAPVNAPHAKPAAALVVRGARRVARAGRRRGTGRPSCSPCPPPCSR